MHVQCRCAARQRICNRLVRHILFLCEDHLFCDILWRRKLSPEESNHAILCRICRVSVLHVHFVLHVVCSALRDRKQYFHSTSCHPLSFHPSVTVSHLVSLVPSHPFLFALGLLSPVFLKPLTPSLYFRWCLSCFIYPCVCVCRTGSLHVKNRCILFIKSKHSPRCRLPCSFTCTLDWTTRAAPVSCYMPEGSISWSTHKETIEDMQRLLNYILVASMWHLTTPWVRGYAVT